MSSIFFNELLPDNVRPRLLHTYMYAQPSCRSINFNSTPSDFRHEHRLDLLLLRDVDRQAAAHRCGMLQAHGDVSGKEIALLRTSSPQNRACELPRTRLKPPRRGRDPAARSTRSWFRLTGGFRHPSFGLFSLRCLTSPSVEASSLIAPLRPAGSLRPFGLGIPARAALSPPLQRSLRFLRHPLPPPPSPSLRSGYRRLAATGRVGLTLLSNVEKRMGRLRPIVRRVRCHRRRGFQSTIRPACPFGSGLSAPLAGSG